MYAKHVDQLDILETDRVQADVHQKQTCKLGRPFRDGRILTAITVRHKVANSE